MAASRTTRWKQQPMAVAVASAFLLSSCSALLPPSLRKLDEPVPSPEVAPAAAAAAEKTSANDTFMEPKVFPGTGTFVNPKPPAPPAAPGPEEASLNFESLDIREVSKVILGDYLKQSYTVHPAVAGTVTFRTVRPIPMKDLLPTLEMLLRQNNAAVVQEEGVYKILPITAVRG